MKILIVEDNAPLALVLSTLLRNLAKRTKIVETVEEAFAGLTGKEKYDTVLLDLTLPESSESETLGAIRRMKEIGANVIVMTGSKHPELKAEVADAGADACFCKTDPDFVAGIRAAMTNGGSSHPFALAVK